MEDIVERMKAERREEADRELRAFIDELNTRSAEKYFGRHHRDFVPNWCQPECKGFDAIDQWDYVETCYCGVDGPHYHCLACGGVTQVG